MSETYNAVQTAPPAVYTLPNNTELADAATFKTNVIKPLINGLAWLPTQLGATLPGRRPPIDSTAAGNVTVGLFTAYFPVAGLLASLSSPATLTNADLDAAPGSYANTSTYFIYASYSAGAIQLQMSLTAPDASLRFKAGAGSWLYLGCMLTDASGAPVPLRAVNGRYFYQESQIIVSSGSATFWSTLALESRVPATATTVHLQAQIVNNSTNARTLSVRPAGSGAGISVSANAKYLVTLGGTFGSAYNSTAMEIATGTTNDVDYQVSGADGFGSIWVTGFSEP